MTALIATLIGIALPGIFGWLLLGLLQGKTMVLDRTDRITAGCVLGLTLSMFAIFCVHVATGMPLTLVNELMVIGALIVITGIASWLRRGPPVIDVPDALPDVHFPWFVQIILLLLIAWVAVKAAIAGTVFLFMTPIFLDDTLDNWNLRGKIFFTDQAITLQMPGEQTATGIASYPPAVPMVKAWIAAMNGEWTEAAANGIHLFWYIAALLLLACTVRRLAGRGWDLLAVYLLGSMPLYLMHGTNPYADAFLAVHILLAVMFPLRALRSTDHARRMALMRIGAVCAAILPFTKNEALLVYLPPLLLIGAVTMIIAVRRGSMSGRDAIRIAAWYLGCLLILALPWLLFKWSNGLTFGNAKSVSGLAIAWQQGVLIAIAVNTFFEGNWLLFYPLLIVLLLWRRTAAFGRWLPLSLYVIIIFVGQMSIFLLTGLSNEARMQTGLARAGVQLMPVMTLLAMMLLADAGPVFRNAWQAISPRKRDPAILSA